eukprot:75880-Pyramimonas_sp.AAC.1
MPKGWQRRALSRTFGKVGFLGRFRECFWRPFWAVWGPSPAFGAILWRLGPVAHHIAGLVGGFRFFLGLSGAPRGRRPGG